MLKFENKSLRELTVILTVSETRFLTFKGKQTPRVQKLLWKILKAKKDEISNNSECTIIVFQDIFNRPVLISNTKFRRLDCVSDCNGTRSKELVPTNFEECHTLGFSYTFDSST
jgi:hypothetical protein